MSETWTAYDYMNLGSIQDLVLDYFRTKTELTDDQVRLYDSLALALLQRVASALETVFNEVDLSSPNIGRKLDCLIQPSMVMVKLDNKSSKFQVKLKPVKVSHLKKAQEREGLAGLLNQSTIPSFD